MKIIIVDDELRALQLFLIDLIGLDLEYKFFKDDETAVMKYVIAEKPEAAFLDINMPGINGINLASELIAAKPSIKIVFTTGLNLSEKDLPPEVALNTLGFLYKPYDNNKLLYKALYYIGLDDSSLLSYTLILNELDNQNAIPIFT